MSEFSKALATEETFEWKGKTYRVSGLVMEVVSQWEHWLKKKAALDLLEEKAYLPAAEYEYRVGVLQRDKAAHQYDFFSPVSLKAWASWEGKIYMTWLRVTFCEGQGDVPIAVIREMQETAIEEFNSLLAKLDEMDADPNRKSPAANAPLGTSAACPSTASAPCSPESPGTTDPGKSAV